MSAVLAPRLAFVPMTLDDLPAVMAIENAAYPFPWTEGNFRDSIITGYSCWLCFEQDRLIGHAVLMQVIDEIHLLNITLAVDMQGQGRGHEFLAHLLSAARGQGGARMLLEVRPSNGRALAFYRREGFAEIGRRRGYYPAADGREDAIVMAREL